MSDSPEYTNDLLSAVADKGYSSSVDMLVYRLRRLASSGDDEQAHGLEDAIHRSVLKAISEGKGDPVALAKAALKTRDVNFSRWCA